MTRSLAACALIAASTIVRVAPARLEAVTCDGIWSPDSSEASLRRHFGSTHVVWAPIDVGEGETEEGSVVYGGDPGKRIEIFWNDAAARRRPSRIVLGEKSSRATFAGISIGTSLKAVERLNGGPFVLAGFGWDYSGTVTDWKDGKLATAGGGKCRLMLRLMPPFGQRTFTAAEFRAYNATSGDRDFQSSDANMQLLNPAVYQILLNYR